MERRRAADPTKRLRSLRMGTEVEVARPDGRVWRGLLVPAHEFSGESVVQLKLDSGYNVGLVLTEADKITVLARPPRPRSTSNTAHEQHLVEPSRPTPAWVSLLTTGGTIASRVDYRTGGVTPVRDEAEFLGLFPELADQGSIRILSVFDRLSEDIRPSDWVTLAQKVGESFQKGASGVVISHGTDTMGFTAAALGFLVSNPPGPVVLVGAQRSPDRPSSDSFTNLAGAIRLARSRELAEVVVLMHEGISDARLAIHRGTRVRKMHSSRRDAFQTRNAPPLGYVEEDRIELSSEARRPSGAPLHIESKLDDRGGLLWYYPGLPAARFRSFARGLRGLVLAGTGLGHVANLHVRWIRAAVRKGMVVAMTTQCVAGEVDPFVYSTGRELLRAGVVFLRDLLPETAYVKLLWALGQSEDPSRVAELLQEDRAGEFVARRLPEVPP